MQALRWWYKLVVAEERKIARAFHFLELKQLSKE